jgi:hypothetical protein
MIHRGWFRVRHFCLFLILSGHMAYSGDGTVSLLKFAGTWALQTIGKVTGAVIAGHAAQQYNANNFDVNTGTFRIPRDISENRGVAVGLQNSPTYETPAAIKEQKEYDRLPREQQAAQSQKYWEEKSKDFTQRELDSWIKTEDSLNKNATEEANYRKRKGQTALAKDNEMRAKEYEATKAILEKEKADRQPRGHIVRQLSDGSLKKLLRNKKEELAFAQKELATQKKYWFPDEQKVADNEYLEKNLQGAIKQIEKEQQNRIPKAVTHVVSTAMVMTSKTAGTDNKTKTEKVPEGGKGSGSNQDPEKDPKNGKGPGAAAAVAAVAKNDNNRNKGNDTPKSPEPTKNKNVEAHREHEAKQFEANQKQMKEARKAERAQMNNDKQPFHEKGIEPKFPNNPGQKDHMFRDEAGHIKERTPNAEKVVLETIEAKNFTHVDQHGNSVYFKDNVNGNQVWAQVRPDGTVSNCGANKTPWPKNPITGINERPKGPKIEGPGVAYAVGAGAVGSLASESAKASNSQPFLSQSTIDKIKDERINPLVAEKIRDSSNPFQLPPPPADHKPLTFTVSPELKAITDRRMDNIKNMNLQDQVKEIMKPIPGMPTTITLPGTSSTFKPSGTGQSTPPVLSSPRPASLPSAPSSTPKASTMIASKHVIDNPKPASLPSAPRSSSSSSAPKPTYTSTPTTISSSGKTYTYNAPTTFKRN